MHLFFTIDPSNIHHVLSKSFANYVKGHKFNEIFEPFGDGILNVDSSLWLYHRDVAQSFFNHPKFHHSLVGVTWKKIELGLIPFLDHVSKNVIEVDLQDLFLRFNYDIMCAIMLEHDPKSLSVDLPSFPLLEAVAYLEHAAILRHVVPTWVWKTQRWLNIGQEKKVRLACKILDNFIYKCIDMKRKERMKGAFKQKGNQQKEASVNLLTFCTDKGEDTETHMGGNNKDKFLRDTISNFILAVGETTNTALSWLFYLLSKNTQVAHKIKEELDTIMVQMNNNVDTFLRNFKEVSNNMVYLHAAICETLRLYPSVSFNHKTPVEPDILPSGHRVNPGTQIIFFKYAMGRMKSIWGDDCNEFKPERWMSESGNLVHVPSYKFVMFGAGPRTCVGKQMAFTQMKLVAAIIIQNYHVEGVQKDHVPEVAMVPRMKHRFKIKVFRTGHYS